MRGGAGHGPSVQGDKGGNSVRDGLEEIETGEKGWLGERFSDGQWEKSKDLNWASEWEKEGWM